VKSRIATPFTGAGITVALENVPDELGSVWLSDTVTAMRFLKQVLLETQGSGASLDIRAQAICLLFVSRGIIHPPFRVYVLSGLMLELDSSLFIMQRRFIRYIQGGEKDFAVLDGRKDRGPAFLHRLFYLALYIMWCHLHESIVERLPPAVTKCALVFYWAVFLIVPWFVAE
jgi:hypothetical protein